MTMCLRACGTLLLFLLACVTTEPSLKRQGDSSPRLANLQRAAALPWKDEGRCVVQEASRPWPVVVDRCFHALDTRRVRFRDTERRCPIASADAASLEAMVGICLLAQPELVVGAVVVIGVVVVAVAIHEELKAHEWRRLLPEDETIPETVEPVLEVKPDMPEPEEEPRPQPEASPSGGNRPPPLPPELLEPRGRRPECTPLRIPPKGGNRLHNKCADSVPSNAFRGANVLVNGKAFDALQLTTRTLWEVKTTAIETYNPFIRGRELDKQVAEGLRESKLAAACGYQFVIGVRTEAHKKMLKLAAPDLSVELMPWC